MAVAIHLNAQTLPISQAHALLSTTKQILLNLAATVLINKKYSID